MRHSNRIIDETDLRILGILQGSARTSNAEIARQVDMAPSAVLERIRKLEESGVILGYETRVNPEAFGLSLLAFVFVRTNDSAHSRRTEKVLAEIPEVQEIHHIAGEDCFLVKVRTSTPQALGRLLREKIGSMQSVVATRTTIVLETQKESGQLPLNIPAVEESHA
ncbi:MAG TPA: Lrp/AsnC family transcriptional regulator [Candidatus Acidoferrales bacterium]|jgi:Lrp/AsnC family leucine-responsive transcriptional regulator|nr:Lrp/AsnC family transcriptional regulator [Candidatus Acidoferrales bacterium]